MQQKSIQLEEPYMKLLDRISYLRSSFKLSNPMEYNLALLWNNPLLHMYVQRLQSMNESAQLVPH